MTRVSQPVPIRHWSCIASLNGLGEAILTVGIGTLGEDEQMLIVAVNPRTVEIIRTVMINPHGDTLHIDPKTLPYAITDLAVTVTQETFPLGRTVARR